MLQLLAGLVFAILKAMYMQTHTQALLLPPAAVGLG
jgi:hypothetical protein